MRLQRAFYLSGAAILALALCLHLFLFARGFYSIGWDESGRTLDAHAWATRGAVVGKAWLPFYRICVGLGLKLHPDLFLTPRVITLLFGLGTIVATAWLAHELFGSRKTTLLTLALAALLPHRVALSLAPLSDIMFALAILAAMATLRRWLNASQRISLFACAVLAALATTIRYEGWIFAAAVLWVVATSRAALRLARSDLVVCSAILLAFPLWWMVSSFTSTNPIAVVVADAGQFSPWQIVRKNPLVELVITNAVTLNAIGLLSILHFLRRGAWQYRSIIAASFGPLVVVSAVLLLMRAAQTGPSWRMIGVWSMLLLPFTAYVLAGGRSPALQRDPRAARAAATILVVGAFVYDVFRLERESSWAFPQADRRAGQYLNDMISAQREPGSSSSRRASSS